jgi:tripartite-type tricarboxylate transporter receptor subunit TctC
MRLPRLSFACAGIALTAAMSASSAVHAQTAPFPNKPVRMIVGAAPGGSTDTLARMLAPHLSKQWGQPVVIENRPGAGGNTAAEYTVKAPPDGHTLMMYHDGLAASATLYTKLPFDPASDLVPVALVAKSAIVVGVSQSLGVTTLKGLLDLAKAKPGELTYASCGVGTPHHIAAEMFKSMANVEMAHVSYKGCGPAVLDILGGHVPVFFQTLSNVADHMRAGRIRVLAVADASRVPEFPNIPTVSEAGVPGFAFHPWYGVFAPKGTPKDIVARINADISKAVALPEVHSQFAQSYYKPETDTPDQFSRLVNDDIRRLGAVIRNAGITAN